MGVIKDPKEQKILRESGRRLATILHQVALTVKPGIKTKDLDQLAYDLIVKGGDKPAFLDYQPKGANAPYPASLCTSVDEEVVHCVPSDKELVEGEIIGLDLGLEHKGFFTDMAVTVPVGQVSVEAVSLMEATKSALNRAIKVVRAGATVGDIGYAIESFIKPKGYGIVRELCGHGVGRAVHDKPLIPNFGEKGKGVKLEAGMVIAIEPMINLGGEAIEFERDGFAVVTRDGSISAHFEHTLLVTDNGVEIITMLK